MDFHCPPRHAPPASTAGSCASPPGGLGLTSLIQATVYGFDLPPNPTLRINHWFAPVYGRVYDQPDIYTPEMFEQDCAFLARYRLPHFLDERGPVMENVHLYWEGGGRLTADFTELGKFYDIAQRHGANWG